MKPHRHAAVIKAWVDGIPVEVFNSSGVWEDMAGPSYGNILMHFDGELRFRIKPEKVYPVTRLEPEQLRAEYNSDFQGVSEQQALVRIVNYGLRHAIDAGQLVDPSTYMADVRELAAKRNARRDMAIAQAVRDACRTAWREGERDLAAIIATVKD